MPTNENRSIIERTLEAAFTVDVDAVQARVYRMRKERPDADNEALARFVYSNASWKGAGIGLASGLPSNPWAAVPAAVADAALMLHIQAVAAATVATIYEPDFLNDGDSIWELMVPIFGVDVTSQALREVGVAGGKQVTKQLIRKYVSKETLKVFKRVMLRYFGIKVTQKALITKTLPVVGGVIGGTWNLAEVRITGNRVIAYFENRPI
jgi:hypothetical protein